MQLKIINPRLFCFVFPPSQIILSHHSDLFPKMFSSPNFKDIVSLASLCSLPCIFKQLSSSCRRRSRRKVWLRSWSWLSFCRRRSLRWLEGIKQSRTMRRSASPNMFRR